MGQSQHPQFYDWWAFGHVHEHQHQLFLSLETPGHLTNPRNSTRFLINFKTFEIHTFENVRKGGHHKSRRSSDKILKILDMRSMSSKKHEMDISQSGQHMFQKHATFIWFSNLWNQETLKPSNQETKHPETKNPRNQETFQVGESPNTSANEVV